MLVATAVRLVRAPNPSLLTGPGTNSYLVGESELAIIDPGPPLPEHVDTLLQAATEIGGRITRLLVTHAHADHSGAAAELRQRTGAILLGPPDVPGVDHSLVDGEEITIERLTLRSYLTPGHADQHFCFWLEESRLLFTGDLVAGQGTVVLSERPDALERYLGSLRAMLALRPALLAPGHGPVVQNGAAKIAEYLAHRAQRDQQILQALLDGPRTVEELVSRIYVEAPPALQPLAARNVRAHLERLGAQGQVVRIADRWQLVASPRA